MDLTPTPRLQRIGSIILFLTIVPIVILVIIVFLDLRGPRYDVTIAETGEAFTVTEPLVMGGDGYQNYEIRQKGRRAIYGYAESGEGSGTYLEDDRMLCVQRSVDSPREDGCLFFFDPKTRQASVARFE